MPGPGTGFVVHNDEKTSCLILTCYHVVNALSGQGNRRVLVKFEGVDAEAPAEVLHSIDLSDLALLRVRGAFPNKALEFSDDTNLSGRDVVMIGYFRLDGSSALETPASTHGTIMSEPVDVIDEPPKFFQHIVCDYHADKGSSGGPVILDVEKVVGVNYQMNMGTSFAITAATVKSVLKRWLERRDNDPDLTIKGMLQLRADQA